jgi:extracellular elastinolytic metalloproteinase
MQVQRQTAGWLAGVFIAGASVLVATQGGPGTVTNDGQGREKVKGYQRESKTLGRGFEKLSEPAPGDPVAIATGFLLTQGPALGLVAADFEGMFVTSEHTSEHNGVTHVYVQQQYRGIPVHTAVSNINVMRDGAVLSLSSSFVEDVASVAAGTAPSRTAAEAAHVAAVEFGRTPTEPFELVHYVGGEARESVLSTGGIAEGPVTASLVYQPVGPREVRLGWLIEIAARDGERWQTVVDAATGVALYTYDMVDRDHWPSPFVTDAPGEIVLDAPAPAASATPHAHAATAGLSGDPVTNAYRVFAMPKESPNDGPATLVVNPADPLASPFGWHDTNGVAGAEWTITRGNNVHAGVDLVSPNGIDPGGEAEGGPDLVFDFPLDLTQGPQTYRPFAVTNLFYWNNLVHDFSYHFGFTELAGNFQEHNYGRGPTTGTNMGALDSVRAEAQDFGGTNNANFSTGTDGNRPRMQMYIWTSPTPNEVFVPSGGAAGTYVASAAAFGPAVSTPLTAAIIVGIDPEDAAGPSGTDGCSPLLNAGQIAGNIALLDRGTCPFVDKVQHAQNAGAIAVIIGNNAPGAPITLGGTAPGITIPSGMVALAVANLFKANNPIAEGTFQRGIGSVNRDSDLDGGIIAHEYAHGISNRLTGGRTVVNCLGNQEQMGEGWSDFYSLIMTAKATDTGPQRRGIGTYVLYQGTNGNGIRPTPYSTDMSINPSTYDVIKTAAVPHGVGYVWATMLWDMYWDLVGVHGFNANLSAPWHTGGNNLATQLVMDGMKLQPCQPGFVTGRNAILQADVALTSGANQCTIWQAFARRGLGYSASQGLSTSRLDGTQAFDVPLACQMEIGPPVTVMRDAQAGRTVPVRFSLNGDATASFAAGFPTSHEVACATGAPLGPASPAVTESVPALTYDPASDHYQFDWKTERAWAGTCRAFTMRMNDGSLKTLFFSFR